MGINEQVVKVAITNHIKNWIELIKVCRYKVPEWDSEAIAQYAIERTQEAHNNSDDSKSFIKDAFRAAHQKMAGALYGNEICKMLGDWAKSMKVQPDKIKSCENFAQDVVCKAIEKWSPYLEADWSQPGHKFAWGIAQKLIKGYIVGPVQPIPINIGNDDDNGGVSEGEIASGTPFPYEGLEPIDRDKLAKVIDEWLANQPQAKAIAFVLDSIYGVPKWICGYIAKHRPTARYRSWWQRQYQAMCISLWERLEAKEREYTNVISP